MKKKINFNKGIFLTSALKLQECPNLSGSFGKPLLEFAIIGRSNVGKSSLLNHLMGQKNLAKTSSTPGKTRRMQFFLIDEICLLVDLPGYGYAKVNHTSKKEWGTYLDAYLKNRQNLSLLLFLLDIRRIPNEEDLTFLNWAQFYHFPLILILTKSDKLSNNEKTKQTKIILKKLSENGDFSKFPLIHYSIKEKTGKQKLIQTINEQLWA